jgi:hypothetical protein
MFNLTVLEENNFTNRRSETHSAFDLRGLKIGHLGTVKQLPVPTLQALDILFE